MQKLFLLFIVLLLGMGCQNGIAPPTTAPNELIENRIVEASCGQCQFHLKGKGCNLAVRIDGKAYFVDGTGIDDHGDAHASDGLCTRIRKALVTGRIVNNRFQASAFQLRPQSHTGLHPHPRWLNLPEPAR